MRKLVFGLAILVMAVFIGWQMQDIELVRAQSDQVCPGDVGEIDDDGWIKIEGSHEIKTGNGSWSVDEVTYTAESGNIIEAVCTKGGEVGNENGYFFTSPPDSNTHHCEYSPGNSDQTKVGDIDINNVGNQSASVERSDDGCAEISHASFKVEEDEDKDEPQKLKKISPILECVEPLENDNFRAYFGYESHNTQTVEIPVGEDNKITGGGLSGIDQGQITEFLYPAVNHPAGRPGRSPFDIGVFSVEFDGSNLVWTLISDSGRTATASKNSKLCPLSGCTDPDADNYDPEAEIDDGSCEIDENGNGEEPTPTATPPQTISNFFAEDISCEDFRLRVRYELEENGSPVEGADVTFNYKDQEIEATTNEGGVAGASYDFAGEDTVSANADGYPDREITVRDINCPAQGGVLGATTEEPTEPEGEVLGATTYADTGTFADVMAAVLGLEGIVTTSVGSYLYARKRNQK